MRALLSTPMMTAETSPEAFGLIRRHSAWLRDWMATYAGWRLDITAEYCRLRKVPPDVTDASRPARDPKSSQAFTRRRYIMLCLTLAVLERADRQTTLSRIAESLSALAAADAALVNLAVAPEFKSSDERRDLVHVVRLLVAMGVLEQQDGDEQEFVNERGDVLYRIRRSCLAAVLSTARGPSTVGEHASEDRLRLLVDQIAPESEEARNRKLRWLLTRRLLEDPILYTDDLGPDERAYFDSQRPNLVRRVSEATGLIAEVRAEGIAMIDDRGGLTDLAVPEDGTDGHIVLLVAEYLGTVVAREPTAVVPLDDIAAYIAGARDTYGSYWRRDAREASSDVPMANVAIDKLCAMRLAKLVPGGVRPLPAVARFRGAAGRERRVTQQRFSYEDDV